MRFMCIENISMGKRVVDLIYGGIVRLNAQQQSTRGNNKSKFFCSPLLNTTQSNSDTNEYRKQYGLS